MARLAAVAKKEAEEKEVARLAAVAKKEGDNYRDCQKIELHRVFNGLLR